MTESCAMIGIVRWEAGRNCFSASALEFSMENKCNTIIGNYSKRAVRYLLGSRVGYVSVVVVLRLFAFLHSHSI
jgi:hypothetical protein